ncbi:MAG TPA: oxidoreductase, partial [Terriglobales bacterium]|nr:oxidoreductase [Terriglobales bacterium]
MDWNAEAIPPQDGKLAVITGASGGLGFEVAKVLVKKGAEVIIAARNTDKGKLAARTLGRSARFEPLDLADLESVRSFADRVIQQEKPIALLINNAGLAAPPKRLVTRDGFELQFGTNFLGHFALTALLLPMLQKRLNPRVVTVSSLVERSAKIDMDDLMSARKYSPTRSYGQSKLANLLFARELQRRSDLHSWGLLSVAAHPGIAVTELTKSRPGQPVLQFNKFFELISPFIGQSAARGALPILYAATS